MGVDVPLSRTILGDRVKDHLLQAIMSGRFPPGSRIVETRVARELGISQAPVREALRDLEALGIVDIAVFRGARVRHPSTEELLEAYGIRAELESLGARLALATITDADIDELCEYVDRMRRAAEQGDTLAETTADVTFHRRIVQISGNQTLERVWRYLEPGSRTYITMAIAGADQRRIADLHVPILEALRDRDVERAVESVRGHFRTVSTMFGVLWDASPDPPGTGPTTGAPDAGTTALAASDAAGARPQLGGSDPRRPPAVEPHAGAAGCAVRGRSRNRTGGSRPTR